MPFVPSASLSSTLDQVISQRLALFRDALSTDADRVKEDMARRGIGGPHLVWKRWSLELEGLPKILEEDAFAFLDESGVALTQPVCEWLATALERHLETLTQGLAGEVEARFPGEGIRRRIAEFMQRMKARLSADLRIKGERAALRGTGRIDALTQLLDRGAFDEDLRAAVRQAEKGNKALTLLFLDIDRFKPLNDNFGHPAGDDALVKFAERVKAALGEHGTAYRYGGDEFAVIMPDCGREDGATRADALREAVIREPLTPHPIDLDVSVGVARYPADESTAEGLIARADAAMYAHKESRRKP